MSGGAPAASRPRVVALPRAGPAAAMPPYALPAEHLVAGALWLVLGAAGLVSVAPDLARGSFLEPRVIGVTHAFTLGWITTCIFGALYQVYPVALGVGARSVRLGHVTFWTLQAGVAALVAGAWFWRPRFLAVGWLLLFLAVGFFSWNVLPQRRKAARGRRVGLYVSGGHVGLGLALLLVGASVAVLLGWWPRSWPPLNRLGVLSAHAHLAVVGFATLTAVGVGSKLLPTFLLSRGHPEWPLRWIGPIVLTGLVAFALGAVAGPRGLEVAGGSAVAGALLLYLWLAAGYFRHRTRSRLERPLVLVASAHLFLVVAIGLGILLLIGGPHPPRLVAAYGIVGIVGWLSLLVAGVHLKVLPFLTWLHRFSGGAGKPGVPKPADMTRPLAALAALLLLPSGVALLAGGAAVGAPRLTVAGSLAFLGGAAALLAQVVWLAVVRVHEPDR